MHHHSVLDIAARGLLSSRPRWIRVAALLAAASATALLAACGGGSSDAPPKVPQATIVLGPQEVCDRDLSVTPADTTVFGATAGDYLADRFSLASGDFNDDGIADVLVGAPLADGPGDARENAGEAYIIFGTANPPAAIDLAQGAAVAVIGENPGDNLGFTVASGDVNGDGRDDAIVGARFASTASAPGAGKAYVFFGREDLSGVFDTAAGGQDVTVTGHPGDFLTIALTTGDVNGDDIDDLLIGAAGASGPNGDRPTAGGVFVVPGSADMTNIYLQQTPAHLTVYGAASGDNIPNHLAAGDLDGDGRDELIIGAPLADGDLREDAGAVYIVPVPKDGGEVDLASGDGFVQITGGARKDALGFQVTSGDVNGDGLDDLIAGARDADGTGDAINNGGEVHVLFGKKGLPEGRDLLNSLSDVTITGGDATDSAGFSVTRGDVNGDGITDIVTGAPVADSCHNEREDGGEAYAVFGRDDWPEGIALHGAGDLTYLGEEAGDDLGFSVATGDFNGDGVADVMLGALQADGPDNSRPDAGELYIILSKRQ